MMRYFVFVYCISIFKSGQKKKRDKGLERGKKHDCLTQSNEIVLLEYDWHCCCYKCCLKQANNFVNARRLQPKLAKCGRECQFFRLFFRTVYHSTLSWIKRERERESEKSKQQQNIAMKQCYTFQNAMCIFIAKDKIYVAFCSWHQKKEKKTRKKQQQFESI